MARKFFYFSLLAVFLSACNYSPYSKELKQTLRLAGSNRAELEKVLEYYQQHPEDSLKYKAAVFLIENMTHHYYFDSPALQYYFKVINSIFQSKGSPENDHLGSMLRNATSRLNPSNFEIKYDIENISSSFLINHIDKTFELRNYPWSKHISEELFFEHILPYRVNTEPVEDWLSIYQTRLGLNIDSLIKSNVADATLTQLFMDEFAHTFWKYFFNFPVNLPPSVLLNLNAGDCSELTALSLFATRSLGLSVAWDLTPQWANRSLGHDWAALLGHPAPIPFSFGDNVALGKHLERKHDDRLAKVYRRTYSIQKKSLAMQNVREGIPAFFRNPHLKDVSSSYFDAIDITVELSIKPPRRKQIAYISVFNNADWVPVHWARIKEGEATFTQMAKSCAYLPVYYNNNALYSASHPFVVDSAGSVKMLAPDVNNTLTAEIKRKYPCKLYDIIRERMIGGVFQGANKEDFSDAAVLYTITDYPDVKMPVNITLDNPQNYRYVRYVSADLAFVYMAEIEFYNEKGEKLFGSIIGTDGSYDNEESGKTKVFDGNPLTYFDAPIASGGWVGLDLGHQETISKIKYLSWNSDNHINIGERYELFYFDKKWVSLGQQTGNDLHVLVYDNVPSNALLLLKNHTKGEEERIFIYEEGKQVFF
jgi:hypothetical protein